MHSQQPGIEIVAMDAKLEALREAQSASVEERSDQAIWCRQALKHRLNLPTRKHHRHVWAPLGPHNPIDLPKLAAQNMPVKEEKGVECLILSCACDKS
jgi:hypothetical protein